jgi:ferrous iron transport protein B
MIALNMSDMAEARGYKIDIAKLSEGLGGIPVVLTVGNRGQGIEELKEKIIQAAKSQPGGKAAAGKDRE